MSEKTKKTHNSKLIFLTKKKKKKKNSILTYQDLTKTRQTLFVSGSKEMQRILITNN